MRCMVSYVEIALAAAFFGLKLRFQSRLRCESFQLSNFKTNTLLFYSSIANINQNGIVLCTRQNIYLCVCVLGCCCICTLSMKARWYQRHTYINIYIQFWLVKQKHFKHNLMYKTRREIWSKFRRKVSKYLSCFESHEKFSFAIQLWLASLLSLRMRIAEIETFQQQRTYIQLSNNYEKYTNTHTHIRT